MITAAELIKKLEAWSDTTGDYSKTCDTVKCGDPDKPVARVAISMFATPDIIRQAARWQADMLIVHEPSFYSHMDVRLENDPVTQAKEQLLKDAGLVLYRFHDHPHRKPFDMICEGELTALGLPYHNFTNAHWAVNTIELDEPITPRQLGRIMQERLNIAQPKICGTMDQLCSRISLCFGTPGGVFEELRRNDIDIVLTGEACEWMLGEYARDAAQLGFCKALIIMGHIGSERDGMKLLAQKLPEIQPDLAVRYFECGEVYSYPRFC